MENKMYKNKYIVKLPDTDAAGILFFASYIKLAHEAYESFMEEIDFSLKYIIEDSDIFILIAHTEADYKSSLRLQDRFSIDIKVSKIGKTSFELNYLFEKDNIEVASVTTVHVVTDKKTGKPIRLPDKLLDKLKQYQN